MRKNLPKCHFAKPEIEWLGHKLTQSRIAPLETKTAAILILTAAKKFKTITIILRFSSVPR